MAKIKATLTFPRFKYVSGDPPLGICYIASYLRQHEDAEVSILDTTFNHSMRYCKEFLEEKSPDIVGVFVDTLMFNDALEVINLAKQMGAFTVAGGPHATILPCTLVDAADVVVTGEGERTFTHIARALNHGWDMSDIPGICYKKNGKIIENDPACSQEPLDSLPFPAIDLLDMKDYLKYWYYLDCVDMGLKGTTMITSRGCPFGCTYCQPTLNNIFGRKLRHRSPLNVVSEMKFLNKNYGINAIFFHDDTMTVNKEWILEFCNLLEDARLDMLWGCNSRMNTIDSQVLERMHKVGLRNIHFGIESGSQKTLDEVYKKGIKLEDVSEKLKLTKHMGIHTFGFFMLGAPEETREDIKRTIDFAVSLDLDEASFSITNPLPGTHLYDMVAQDERYSISEDYSDFDYYRNRAWTNGFLSPQKLKDYQRKALLRFYLHPKRFGYMRRHFTSKAGAVKLCNKLRRFF